MTAIRHFKRAELKFDSFGSSSGKATIARVINPDRSRSAMASIRSIGASAMASPNIAPERR